MGPYFGLPLFGYGLKYSPLFEMIYNGYVRIPDQGPIPRAHGLGCSTVQASQSLNSDPFNLRAEEMAMADCPSACQRPGFFGELIVIPCLMRELWPCPEGPGIS